MYQVSQLQQPHWAHCERMSRIYEGTKRIKAKETGILLVADC